MIKIITVAFDEYVYAQVNAMLKPWIVNFLDTSRRNLKKDRISCFGLIDPQDLQVLANENLLE